MWWNEKSTGAVYIGSKSPIVTAVVRAGRQRREVISIVESSTPELELTPSAAAPAVDSEQKLQMVCVAVDEHKARDIVSLDVRGLTTLADFFVMCSGTSTTHIQSIAEGVREKLRERASLRAKPEGDVGSLWIILDYGDVILHIFDSETREFYDLERLWADAKVRVWKPDQSDGEEG